MIITLIILSVVSVGSLYVAVDSRRKFNRVCRIMLEEAKADRVIAGEDEQPRALPPSPQLPSPSSTITKPGFSADGWRTFLAELRAEHFDGGKLDVLRVWVVKVEFTDAQRAEVAKTFHFDGARKTARDLYGR